MRSFTRRAAAWVFTSLLTVSAGIASAQAPVTPAAKSPPAVAPAPAPALSTKPEPRPTGIAAKINNQEISEVAVWRALRQFPKEEQELARKEILSHLTENTLIDQYLAALKMEVKAEEVEKLVNELKIGRAHV